jgi:hypothetical protein
MMIPNAHMPEQTVVVIKHKETFCLKLTPECKRELKERDCSSAAGPKAVIHDFDIRVSSTKFPVDDD